jgi:hypothetical protein
MAKLFLKLIWRLFPSLRPVWYYQNYTPYDVVRNVQNYPSHPIVVSLSNYWLYNVLCG